MTTSSAAHWRPSADLPGYVTDGGMETDLIFHHGVDLPEFAAYPLVADEGGRSLLTDYYLGYARVAARVGAGLFVETPTWRANSDWGARLGHDAAALAEANAASVNLAADLARRFSGDVPEVVVSGMVGPRGDGYRAGESPEPEEARAYHLPQVRVLADSGVDLVTALTLGSVGEALGVVLAARESGVPVVVGFTVETDGCLPDGTALSAAIAAVDDCSAPEHYVVNCAHPTHVSRGLADAGPWRERIVGTRVNSSALSHAELDEAETLDEGDPLTLGRDQVALASLLPALRVVGGCCGTDVRHVAAMWGVPAPA
ncbi:MAG: homocysteine S-methyltransferase family protein [Ornithinibacter sp.]